MDHSALGRLPAELRNDIFQLALSNDAAVPLRPGNEPALLLTCRQIRQEARSVFWANNEFSLSAGSMKRKDLTALEALDAKIVWLTPKLYVNFEIRVTESNPRKPQPSWVPYHPFVWRFDHTDEILLTIAEKGFKRDQVQVSVKVKEGTPTELASHRHVESRIERLQKYVERRWDAAVEYATWRANCEAAAESSCLDRRQDAAGS